MTRPDEIHIAAACDESYAMPLAVMLSSVEAHLGPDRRATAHVLASRVSQETRLEVERSIRAGRIDLRWLSVEIDRLDSLRSTLRSFDSVSIESYYRLLLPELLPQEIRKLIYLDCDVVVNHDLGDLWDHDVSDTCLLAVPELAADSRTVSSKAGIRFYRELGLPADLAFFNSGVLLLNLERCRAGRIMDRTFAYLNEAKNHLRWHDQEGLNVAVAADWRELDPRWNVTMHLFRESCDAELAECLRDPFIVHYNSAIKPWHADFSFGFRDLFFEHLDATAWAGWRPRPSRFGILARSGRRVLRAIRKRRHRVDRFLSSARLRWHRWRVLQRRLPRLDAHRVPERVPEGMPGEVRGFVVCESLDSSAARRLGRYLENGVDRVFVAVTKPPPPPIDSAAGAPERTHLFDMANHDRSPHEVLRHLLHRYGEGHWCLLIDDGELDSDRHTAPENLGGLCRDLDRSGYDAVFRDVGESPTSQRPSFASDPLTGRAFACRAFTEDAASGVGTGTSSHAKISLIKYRRDLELSQDLRAVHGARVAGPEYLLARLQQPIAVSDDRPGESRGR